MALTSRGAANSLVTIFPPFDRNLRVMSRPYIETFDLSKVAAPRVPCRRFYSSGPALFALHAASSITAAPADSRVNPLPPAEWPRTLLTRGPARGRRARPRALRLSPPTSH